MPKKSKKVQDEIKESAGKIWLAGLGALSLAEEEGGKLFKNLVSRGESYESELKKPVEKATGKVKGTVKKVESAIDEQVGSALKRLGVPTRNEIRDLTEKVEKLTRTIEVLAEKETAASE